MRQGNACVLIRLDPYVLEKYLLGFGVVLQDGVDDVHARPLPFAPLLKKTVDISSAFIKEVSTSK